MRIGKEESKGQESIQSSSKLSQDTIWENDKNIRNHCTEKSQETRFVPAGNHKAEINRLDSMIKTTQITNNKNDSQKNHYLKKVRN